MLKIKMIYDKHGSMETSKSVWYAFQRMVTSITSFPASIPVSKNSVNFLDKNLQLLFKFPFC